MAQPHNKKLGEYPMTTRGREQGPEKRYRRLRFPAFTAAKWTTANPLLQRGELGVETDTRKIKVGDGITYWNDLEYAKAYSDWGNIAGDITEQTDLVDFVNAAVAAEANIRSQADQQLQANIDNVAADLSAHEQDTNNPHDVTKAQVGLGNVDNTSDTDKPVSNAQATAINNAVSEHNTSDTAHSNLFSQYRTSANQDNIDSNLQSQITNNDTDITNLQNTKADKATTLAGYGITDAYTKTEVDAKVSSVYRFRGSVATYANLPTTGQVVGDVWNVEDTGANYAWSGTEWDKLSETVDLTPYLTKTEASSIYATQSALAEVSTVAENAQQTANAAGTTAAQALAGLDSKQDKLGFATATTAGIVRVGDGSQMVVNASTGDISLDGSKAESIRGTIGAVASNQGSSNSGLILGIDASGNVVPTESSSGGRNIGDIFWTTRTDSALNGAVEANGAQYNFADVNQGQNNVQALLVSGALPSVTIAEFDTKVASDGGCDSFGYDSSATYFKVPKKTPRILVRCQKPTADNNYTWYNLYADGWVEQGGFGSGADWKNIYVSLPIEMSNVNYTPIITTIRNANPNTEDGQNTVRTISTTGFVATSGVGDSTTISWQVSGYAASSEYAQSTWDYQNVQVERPMIQLFNGVTDEAVATCTQALQQIANIQQALNGMDYPIYWDSGDATDHSHAKPGVTTPAAGTWYRLYKSGWVEQGGGVGNPEGSCILVTLPIGMTNTSFTAIASGNTSGIAANYNAITCDRRSSTQIAICTTGQQGNGCSWRVDGYAA